MPLQKAQQLHHQRYKVSFDARDGWNVACSLDPGLGQISASLTSFSRTIDEYDGVTKRELVQTKQEKGFERVKTFRGELLAYREQFEALKKEREESVGVLEREQYKTHEILTGIANIDQSLGATRTKTT